MLTIGPTRISHGYLMIKTGPPLCPSFNVHIIMTVQRIVVHCHMQEINLK